MTKSERVVQIINEDWGENWDVIVDFFGENLAKQLEEAYEDIEE